VELKLHLNKFRFISFDEYIKVVITITSQLDTSVKINKKLFLSAMAILLLLMIGAGILTLVVPTGSYEKIIVDGRETIDPNTFQFTDTEPLPVWRWFTAPIEVLWSDDGALVIGIILFILIIGGSISILNDSNVLQYLLSKIVKRYKDRKYLLMAILVFAFMLIGALLGIFEEVIPLVPFVVALAYFLGWDALVGLGMSLLAAGFGFSAAIANPFSIGIAQSLAGLPAFSGAWFRVITFVIIYIILITFLIRYAKKIEKDPTKSLDYENYISKRDSINHLDYLMEDNEALNRSFKWFVGVLIGIIILLISSAFIEVVTDYLIILIALFFLVGGLGSGYLSGMKLGRIGKSLGKGIADISPGIILILMATSVKHIISQGEIMDTILYYAASMISGKPSYIALVLVYLLVIVLEIFIGSASAKAFLLIPLIIPLADLLDINRQVVVLAYAFGDGFSNVLYPTNAVLLIGLGLANVSYIKWFRWIYKLELLVFAVTLILLFIALKIDYGPF